MVYFVGAGSGAIDLITIRGQKMLECADVIIYAGSLVNEELLKFTKKDAAVFNSSYMNLEEIISKILEAEKENKITVRLHTGDPSLFGAIKEQMDILDRNGIKFEVIPGVSSFSAAAAALKVEYTLPGVSQSLIITRFSGKTKTPAKEFEKLAAVGCSMAIFLSMGLIEELSQYLIDKSAYNKDTPVAIVYKASWSDEKIFRCDLKSLCNTAKSNNITKTALILVGNFLIGDYELSKLYDKNYETEFRKKNHEN